MKLPTAYAKSVKKMQIDMTLSVNPLGCSPRALTSIRRMDMKAVSSYPDSTPFVAQLAQRFAIPSEKILVSNGSEQLIKLISQTFVVPDACVMVEAGSFFLFSREPMLQGANVTFFDFATAKKPKKKPALVFIANPTTPGGVNRTDQDILRVIDILRPTVAVVDEANAEFRTGTLISSLRTRKNLVVLRTCSKALGIAGLRIGMAFASKNLITKMNDRLQPFPVSSTALIAAKEALRDTAFLKRTIAFVTDERIFLTKALEKRGFTVSPSVTNNLFVSRQDNNDIVTGLASRNVSVIDGSFFPGNKQRGFRVSLRDKKTNRVFLTRLDEVLACLTPNKLLRSKEIV